MTTTIRNTMRNNAPAAAFHRAGMHQKAEMAYRRNLMTGSAQPEAVEEVLEIPEVLADQIPPLEDEDDAIVREIAEEDVEISVGGGNIGEEVPAPDPMIVESDTEEKSFEWWPVTGGVDCEPRIVVCDPGDGIVRAIPDPLGVL